MAERKKPMTLDMSFEEALSRFGRTDPAELPQESKLGRKAGSRRLPAVKGGNKNSDGPNRTRKLEPPTPSG